jgi:hypothetical protein
MRDFCPSTATPVYHYENPATKDVQPLGCCVNVWLNTPSDEYLRSEVMPRAKSPRTTKPKAENKILQMPETSNGNGHNGLPADLESKIRLRAYEIYEQRGDVPGSEQQDWIEAEREVLARYTAKSHSASA